MTIVEFYNPEQQLAAQWSFVSDKVMGGVSDGQMIQNHLEDQAACFKADVSLENNGGFAQLKVDMRQFMPLVENDKRRKRSFDHHLDASDYDGVYLDVKGNGEQYNVHLRTSQLSLPWQSFRQTFVASEQWQRLFFRFDEFEAHRCNVALAPDALMSLGVVAIGRAFSADVCIRGLGVYRSN